MLEGIIIGAIQGIAEWLPVSSEGIVILAQVHLLGSTSEIVEMVKLALFLHLGTFFAALVYFWADVKNLTITLFSYKKGDSNTRTLLRFLVLTTIISGILGYLFFETFEGIASNFEVTGKLITGTIGALLLVTALSQIKKKKDGLKDSREISTKDTWVVGIAQGFSVLPGISRSGITVAVLLLRKFKEEEALRLSFLMSLPIVLVGNIVLNLGSFSLTGFAVAGLISSFVFGILTIHYLFKLASKINFGWFVLVFAFLVIVSLFI